MRLMQACSTDFLRTMSLPYRCFLSILALCGAINVNIAERQVDGNEEYGARMKAFLEEARNVLRSQSGTFSQFYQFAVKI